MTTVVTHSSLAASHKKSAFLRTLLAALWMLGSLKSASGQNDPNAGHWPTIGPELSSTPSDADLRNSLVLSIPFVVLGESTLEDRIAFLDSFEPTISGVPNRIDATVTFLDKYPDSPYRLWAGASAGVQAFNAARYSLAEKILKMLPSSHPAVAVYLARLYALRGDMQSARSLLATVDEAKLFHPLPEQYRHAFKMTEIAASETPWTGWSGYEAAAALAKDLGWSIQAIQALNDDPPRSTGVLELRDWTSTYGLDLMVVNREPGSATLGTSIVLWKHGHYREIGIDGRSLARTHTQGSTIVSAALLDEEGSRYYLVESGTSLPEGYTTVSDEVAQTLAGERLTPMVIESSRPDVRLKIKRALTRPGEWVLHVNGAPGKYRLSASSNLNNPAWNFILPDILITPDEETVIPLGNLKSSGSSYYRLQKF
ncbi:MAG: hypothetical protein KDN22_23120 [Verrucomicrobiae bacterium]|nr:hypothetical protein [Verrucomicrobiae bacterium]